MEQQLFVVIPTMAVAVATADLVATECYLPNFSSVAIAVEHKSVTSKEIADLSSSSAIEWPIE